MIKKFKIFENSIIPEIGSYVIISVDRWKNNKVKNFFKHNIGFISHVFINYSHATQDLIDYDMTVVYDYVPEYIKKFTKMRMVQGGWAIYLDEISKYKIIDISKNEEELKMKLSTRKYNL